MRVLLNASRSTMRRILATLAVVGALLFSAGSAWGVLPCRPKTDHINKRRV